MLLTSRRKTRGFTLIELLVVIAIIALLISILLPAIGEARRSARLAKGSANMRSIAQATNTYAAEARDLLFSFSWRPGTQPFAASDPFAAGITMPTAPGQTLEAARAQMTYIIRSRSGDPSWGNLTNEGFVPHFRYSHLVLLDFMSARLPDPVVINPEDQFRTLWSQDPRGYAEGLYSPNFGNLGSTAAPGYRQAFSGSYLVPTAHWDNSRAGNRVIPNSAGSILVFLNGTSYGGKKLTDVSFPSQKVVFYDTFGRHFGRPNAYQWQCWRESRQPLGFYDGSVQVKRSGDANIGRNPNDGGPTQVTYVTTTPAPPPNTPTGQPDPISPPDPWGGTFWGWPYFSSTMHGLRGFDFGGREPVNFRRNEY